MIIRGTKGDGSTKGEILCVADRNTKMFLDADADCSRKVGLKNQRGACPLNFIFC